MTAGKAYTLVAFDTAGPVVGVGLLHQGRVFTREARGARGTEAHLMPWLLALLEEAGAARTDIDGVVACTGPGAFTGLRVGLASALGLAVALGLPVWPCESLLARAAAAAEGGDGTWVAALDARKGKLYVQAFTAAAGAVRALSEPADLCPDDVLAWMKTLPQPVRVTGEGALVFPALSSSAEVSLAEDPGAVGLGAMLRLGAQAFAAGEVLAADAVRPRYVRAPDAKVPRSLRGRTPGVGDPSA